MLLSIEIILKLQPKCVFLHVYSYPIRSNGLSSLAHQEFSIPPIVKEVAQELIVFLGYAVTCKYKKGTSFFIVQAILKSIMQLLGLLSTNDLFRSQAYFHLGLN